LLKLCLELSDQTIKPPIKTLSRGDILSYFIRFFTDDGKGHRYYTNLDNRLHAGTIPYEETKDGLGTCLCIKGVDKLMYWRVDIH